MGTFSIVRNKERYGDTGAKRYPDEFTVTGLTAEQADRLAEDLSNHESGCDYAFYVKGGEGDEQ